MKLILFFLSLCWLTACATTSQNIVNSNSQVKEELVKRNLDEFFELCKADDYKKVANYIAYRGDDKIRNWKDVANYDNSDERHQVETITKGLHKFLNQWDKYTVIKYFIDKESGLEWNVLTVLFQKADKKTKKSFAFLKIKGRFIIGDID